MTDLRIRCACGQLEGVATGITPTSGTHLFCYCDDCQTFQHVLGQAERVLDEHGGTELYQMSAGQLTITRGTEHLKCLRLSPKGTLRWFADCCNTSIGNTMASPAVAFVGVTTVCFDRGTDPEAVDRALGPLQKGVFGKYASGEPGSLDAYDGVPFSAIPGFIRRLVRWRWRGDHKHSPFFDHATGELVTTPRVLTKAERDAARKQVGKYANP